MACAAVLPWPCEGRQLSNIKYDISESKHPLPVRRNRRMPDPLINAQVSDEDFQDILDATRDFVRSVVMPRELEIMNDNRVPDDIRDRTKAMGLFGYAI